MSGAKDQKRKKKNSMGRAVWARVVSELVLDRARARFQAAAHQMPGRCRRRTDGLHLGRGP